MIAALVRLVWGKIRIQPVCIQGSKSSRVVERVDIKTAIHRLQMLRDAVGPVLVVVTIFDVDRIVTCMTRLNL